MRVKVFRTGTLKGALVGGYSGLPIAGAYFGVLAIASSSEPDVFESKDKIASGKKASYGDRACRHFAMKGDGYVFSSSGVKHSIASVMTYPGYTPATTTQSLTSLYRDTGVKLYDVVGPVACGSIPAYSKTFPEMESSKVRVTEISLKIVPSGSGFKRIVHYVSTNKSTGISTTTHTEVSYEIDFVGLRYREVGKGWYNFVSLATSSYSFDPSCLPKTWRDWNRLMKRVSGCFTTPDIARILGDLVRRCANDAQVVQTNSIELIRDIREVSDAVRSAYALTKGKLNAKKIASGYLQYKYGLRLTVEDLKLVAKTVNEQMSKQYLAYHKVFASNVVTPERLVQNTVGDAVCKYTYSVHYRPYSQDYRRALQLIWDSGLFPSLQNSWDLIPLSFVADWFTQLGDRLSTFDASTYWSLYDVISSCQSVKTVYTDVMDLLSTSSWTLIGQCDISVYERSHSPFVMAPSYFENSPREFRNYAEALALIVANIK